MGIIDELDDNKKYLCLPLIAPFVLLGAVIMIGWSEKRSVCRAKAIDQGRDAAIEVNDCNDANIGAGELVFFNCDLQPTGLDPSSLGVGSGKDLDVSFPGVCLKTASEVMRCKETAVTPAPPPSPPPPTPPTPPPPTTYTYEKAWSTTVNTASFNDQNAAQNACGVTSNPSWSSVVPASSTVFADSVKAGAWTITSELSLIACDTALSAACDDGVPDVACSRTSSWASIKDGVVGWTKVNDGSFNHGTGTNVGDYRVTFTGNNWASPGVTGLGLNDGGTLKKWTADSDWLCDGDTLYEFSLGTKTLDECFSDLESANAGLTWFLRIFGLLLLWGGFFCCLGPLVFVAEMVDNIPFIGDFVSDVMYYVIVAVSCMPACACCLFVTGICWMAMRPMIGVPCFLFSLLLFGIFGFASYRNKEKVKADPTKSKSRKSRASLGGENTVVGQVLDTE